jgi:alkanesulfonate monooxygenase SsuD/methylene tetrahydromethanopterin reductase-like flavin-dependent oxidoreductase (luciferase family)
MGQNWGSPSPDRLWHDGLKEEEAGAMQFGIFDHLDNNHLPLGDFYEERLRLLELYDRAGFYCWHVAEHHATTLGMAPSPNLFLASAAQRTKRLRFGPMVYALPLYHPLRLAEEIAMLDQLSRGRLDMGFGRGSSPVEIEYFGVHAETTESIYRRDLPLILEGLATGRMHFADLDEPYRDVALRVMPLQKPYPPVWYGVHTQASAERAARNGWTILNLDVKNDVRECNRIFRDVWREVHGERPLPLMGLGRFVVVADTDEEANAIARRAYPRWHDGFTYLFRTLNRQMTHARPPTWDGLVEQGRGIAGSPATVRAYLTEELTNTASTYCVLQPAFGDQTFAEVSRTIELFQAEIMPQLRAIEAVPASA